MKRNLLFAAALMAGVAVSAQDAVNVDVNVVSGSTEYVAVSPMTTVAVLPTSGIEVKTAFQDNYRCVSVATDDFTTIDFDGLELTAEAECGLQGEANPKSLGGTPADNYDNPNSGAVFTFIAPGNAADAKIIGYFYAFGKFSTNKAYFVTISELNAAVGYEVHMVVGGEAQHWVLNGTGEFGALSDADVQAQFGEILAGTDYKTTGTPLLDQMKGYNKGGWIGDDGKAYNGLGYMKFPVYGGCTYYFGASGSKMSANAFAFDAEGDAVVTLKDINMVVGDLQLSPDGEGNAISSVESAAEVVAEEYYTVSGIRVAEMVPGLNLVKQTLSDGSVKTVKVIK